MEFSVAWAWLTCCMKAYSIVARRRKELAGDSMQALKHLPTFKCRYAAKSETKLILYDGECDAANKDVQIPMSFISGYFLLAA
jgi:hypothetical protein